MPIASGKGHGHAITTVIDSVKSELAARYKAPKRVVFVAEVPRAPNGKADYNTAKQYTLDTLNTS